MIDGYGGVDSSILQADSQPSSVGLVWESAATLNETDELSQWLCHDDSTINIVHWSRFVIIIILLMVHNVNWQAVKTASCGILVNLHSVICHYTTLSVTGAMNALGYSCLHNMANSFARYRFDTLKSLPALQSMHTVSWLKTISCKVVGKSLLDWILSLNYGIRSLGIMGKKTFRFHRLGNCFQHSIQRTNRMSCAHCSR